MFGVMGMGGAFMQAAGRAGKEKFAGFILRSLTADPSINSVSCIGEMTVKTIKNGVEHIDQYADLNGEALSISADKNTKIYISGNLTGEWKIGSNTDFIFIKGTNTALTSLGCYSCYALQELNLSTNTALTSLNCGSCNALQELNLSTNTALTSLDCYNCYALQELNLSTNTALTSLNCYNCYALQELNLSTNTALTSLDCSSCSALQELNLSTNTALTSLDCYNCYALQELNLSTNTALTSLDCSSCSALQELKYPATNSDVSTAIAGAITNATAADGTVYTDSAAAYYSTIETAANNKGWTIEQLS